MEITVSPEMLKFLCGEGPLDGVWFGDPHPKYHGMFWWRAFLRQEASQPEAVETDGWTLEEVHGAISKALDEAGIRNEVLRGQCIIAGLESLPDGSAPQTG
jgi:hypothetical protein